MLEKDRKYVWHPYDNPVRPGPVSLVRSAAGVRLQLDDGRQAIDGMSSWWAAIHGYRHPDLDRAATQQLQSMAHVMFGGLTHTPAIELAEKLVEITSEDLDKVFISDSGSVAVEVAMKMAIQYWSARGVKKKTRFAALTGGYHGDTFGAMSVCDPETGMHKIFGGAVARQLFLPRPPLEFSASVVAEMETMLSQNRDELAALILEPGLQGAGGMWFYDKRYLQELRRICTEQDILFIADEIATGFGRTGLGFFVTDDIGPDILCLGKALTGGYLSLAATLTTAEIAEFIGKQPPHVFMHGPTFMGNPLACAVALANLEILSQGHWKSQVETIESIFRRDLTPLEHNPAVHSVRVGGGVGVVEMHQSIDMEWAHAACLDSGVWLRPFGKLLYSMPPYVSTQEDLSKITAVISFLVKAIAECEVDR